MTREEVIQGLVPHYQDTIAAIKAQVPKEQHDKAIEFLKEAVFFDSRLDPEAVDCGLEVIKRCVRQGGGC